MRKIVYIILVVITHQSASAAEISSISVCFSPKGNCAQQIISTIDHAKKQVLVQAYSFTSVPIAEALAEAKKRGVDVKVLLDKSQAKGKYSVLSYLNNQNIATRIDYLPAIAHNKVMVIDGDIVVTGSYNFTTGAERRNTENLLIIHNRPLAIAYVDNWLKRERLSR